MKVAIGLLVVLGLCIVPSQSQSAAELIKALSTMQAREKAALIMDILLRNKPLFDRLEKLLVSAVPLLTEINLKPPLGQVLLYWGLDQLPKILQSEIFLNVTNVVVEDLNKVNLTDVNQTSLDAFMEDYLDRLDLYGLVKDAAVVICKPIFLARALREELYPATIENAIEHLEIFLRDYGERVIHVVIDVINTVNTTGLDFGLDMGGLSDNQTSHSVFKRSVALVQQENSEDNQLKFNQGVIQRLSLVHMAKNVLLNMSDVLAPYAVKLGLNRTLIGPVLHGALELGETLVRKQLPAIATTVIQEINNANLRGLNESDPAQFVTNLGLRIAPNVIMNQLPPTVVLVAKKVMDSINETVLEERARDISSSNTSLSSDSLFQLDIINLAKQIITSKRAREYFPKSVAQKDMSDMCYGDVMDYIDELLVGTKWAVEMFDATGKPPTGTLFGNLHFTGSYDQCLNIQYEASENGNGPIKSNKGKYCRATFNIPPYLLTTVLGYIGPVDTHGVPLTISLGLCLPATCREMDIKYLTSLGPLNSLSLEPIAVECSRSYDISEDKGSIIFMAVAGVIVLFAIVSTLLHVAFYDKDDTVTLLNKTTSYINGGYDVEFKETNVDGYKVGENLQIQSNGRVRPDRKNGHVQTGAENGHAHDIADGETMENGYCQSEKSIDSIDDGDKEGFAERLTKSFSFYKNIPDVLSFERKENDVTCIHGIRFLSMAFIIVGNSFLYTSFSLTGSPVTANLLDALEYLKLFTFQAVLASPFAVDTFFVISGCVVAKSFMEKTEKAGKLEISKGFIGFYIHKYIRITPIYVMVLVGYSRLYHYAGDGPMYPHAIPVADKCTDTWWRHIIYANNLWGTDGNDAFHQCMPWSWFLACLMQFFLITPFLMITFLMSKKLGFLCITFLLAAGTVSAAFKEKQYGGDILSNTEDGGAYWNNVFITPWCRVSTYCVGLLLGYVLYRNPGVSHKKLVGVIGWIVAIGVFVSIEYSPFNKNKDGGVAWSSVQQEVYEALSRPAWACAVAWVVFACHSEMGGFINGVLSWRGFLPLSRLTYGAYLIHPVIMVLFVYSKRVLVYMNNLEMTYMFLGHLTVSYAAALILSVLFERPFLNLERALRKVKLSCRN